MTIRFPSRAAVSVALGIAAPILSSACAHDLQESTRAHRQVDPANAEPLYGAPYAAAPGRTAREPGAIRLPVAQRGRGPTYVEAVFETRKSAVGPPYRERFHGFATVAPDGRSVIEIENVGQTIRCRGRSRVTAPPTGPGATGLRGEAFIACSDGRYATADYRYVTNTRGDGEGRDYLGNRFTIRFMVVP
jgi:hypothetical protein